MIIGLNGYMGSGKDTVGKIIQYLAALNKTSNPEISKAIEKQGFLDYDYTAASGWEIKKFGGKLKQIASLLTGIPVEKFEDQEFKKTNLPKEWDRKFYPKSDSNGDPSPFWEMKPMTVRELLQYLGTDAIRNHLHENTWVNALFSDYKYTKKEGGYQRVVKSGGIPVDFEYEIEYPNWIITDVRFPNEAKAIKEKEGIIIRINRMRGTSLQEPPYMHPSEISLDDWEFDYVINNGGTLQELEEKVRNILTEINQKN